MNVECHYTRAKVVNCIFNPFFLIGNCIFNLGDCTYVKVCSQSKSISEPHHILLDFDFSRHSQSSDHVFRLYMWIHLGSATFLNWREMANVAETLCKSVLVENQK